ncbi:MAG: aminotransferase class V-fold PLP-dependent enzyme, partial [Candidatus Latescibacteria bacterium]|nr:aminotransferase class V-fold PLP-dependent enzyme [bacterium]MBD3422838.1 aminotransferase class V-fold PLP-dependent enzyme [Candidatus Latescibacterota bacterium]
VRKYAADMIGGSASEISFVTNTTSGVLLAAGAVDWEEGDNVVMPGIEFPANVYPWLALRKKGVEVRMVQPEGGRVTAGALMGECDSRTRLVTASMVQFGSGYRINLEEIGNFCRSKGILLHVDGIQGLGALDLDVRRARIDFLSAGGHKWLISMGGAGIFYCREELAGELEIPNPGWTGVCDFMDFLDYCFEYRQDGTRFEEGTLNAVGIMALGTSLERFLEIGMENVQERILSLTSELANSLRERGYHIISPFGESERSGIVSFTHPELEAGDIFEKLTSDGVIVSLRGGAIRVSPHFYNNMEDIKKLLATLER